MRRLVIALTVVMVMFSSSLAMAGAVATGQCPEGSPPECIGVFTLEDLGSFVGDVWTWNQEFVDAHGGQLSWTPECGADGENGTLADWQSCFEPQKVIEDITIKNVRVDRRKYANSDKDHTRFTFKVVGASEVVYMPYFWQDAPQPSEAENYSLIMFFGGEDGQQLVWYETNRMELPAPTVTSTVWNGAFGTEYISQRHEFMYMLKYNTGMRDWYHDFYEEYSPVYHFQFTEQFETLGPQTFTINLSDGSSYDTTVNVTNVDYMPTISAFTDSVSFIKVRPNGKLVPKVKTFNNPDVSVVNITIREIDDPIGDKALIIQWPVPDEALFGNYYNPEFPDNEVFMLRVYVGKYDKDLMKEVYLWIDCPVQAGTVVIYGEHYNWLKDKILAEGMSLETIEMFILYRTVSNNTDGSLDNPHYHNRGYSDEISITPSL
jgi:hypothetical protein